MCDVVFVHELQALKREVVESYSTARICLFNLEYLSEEFDAFPNGIKPGVVILS
jgi:hypothetical protein